MMNTTLHRMMITAAAVAVAARSLSGQEAAPPETTFRSSVDVVTIQTSVRDARGRAVQGLTPADFEVRDNGEVRPVLEIRSDRRSPISVAVLVDMSGSMGVGSKIAMARQAFDTVLAQLRDGQDEVGLFTFDSSLHERCALTSNLSTLKDGLHEFEPFGNTSLYDATAATARRLAESTAARKAVIVLTDGTDTSSELTPEQVSGLASSIDVPVYVLATVSAADQHGVQESLERRSRSDIADLRDLAEWTGGRFTFAKSFLETVTLAAGLVDELRQQYVLAIEANSAREWRRLDVRVKTPSAVVKARSGYYGG
jgi:Ca-activated chloride channel family protein